jgi:hypothetical protein
MSGGIKTSRRGFTKNVISKLPGYNLRRDKESQSTYLCMLSLRSPRKITGEALWQCIKKFYQAYKCEVLKNLVPLATSNTLLRF